MCVTQDPSRTKICFENVHIHRTMMDDLKTGASTIHNKTCNYESRALHS